MNQFYIFTDSACDIKPEILQEWGVASLSLNFRFNGDETLYSDNTMPIEQFYNKKREGMVAKTSAVNS
jgi:fatty acid-binding protein DegV